MRCPLFLALNLRRLDVKVLLGDVQQQRLGIQVDAVLGLRHLMPRKTNSLVKEKGNISIRLTVLAICWAARIFLNFR